MWWKLAGLFVLAASLVFAVIPIRTHAIVFDPATVSAPKALSLADTVGNMYLTPGTVLLIVFILAVAGFVALKVLRGHW
ncbi:MAG: hypothetical protein ACK40O_06580 [Allosphingosinicella sp.]